LFEYCAAAGAAMASADMAAMLKMIFFMNLLLKRLCVFGY
jgi:hypothetical protein